MYDLSVIIPARNEMFLGETVQDVLKNIRGNTEIIVICDGEWPVYGIPDHERLTIVYHSESIGQRASCNEGVKLSTAKYIMKLDAHCAMDEGFDVKLVESAQELGDDVTQIPTQYNLHAFDWLCSDCQHRTYQGKTPDKCEKCEGVNLVRDKVWKPRLNRKTQSWRFDTDLHFQYWGEYMHRPEAQGKYIETMSCLGACWFLSRKRYWEIDGMDEEHGSWGQMGTELGCKSWLSGGRMVTNTTTWFAHMFRTQGGDFGFPYPLSNSDVKKAREHSKKMWRENNWSKAKHDLNWLIEKFSPVPEWHDPPDKEIIFYSDNQLNLKLAHKVQRNLKRSKLPIITCGLKQMSFGNINLKHDGQKSYMSMFRQMLKALEASTADIVFFCEHDVLYHPSHFKFNPTKKDVWYYNTNVYKVDLETHKAVRTDDCRQVSGICVYRETALKHYRKRLEILEEKATELSETQLNSYIRKMGFEPGTHGRSERVDDAVSDTWESEYPNLDIRHGNNLTPTRWSKEQFVNKKYTEGWLEATIDDLDGWDRV